MERHITEYGATDFVVGRYGHFDGKAAHSVKAAKNCPPEVTLNLLLPYHTYDRSIPTSPGFDGTFYLPGAGNCLEPLMVDYSNYLIAYAWHPPSNARDLVEYSQRRKKQGHPKITILTPQKFKCPNIE